mgnify:FL=1|jgi:hypothetical protein|tara:strand:- start:6835 stop:7041 length:207 start_codon:yes stop_codon:yes gene_type:complete
MAEDSPIPKRMTVKKLGQKVDEMQEVVDIIHSDIGELKELLKTLIELQIVKTPEIAESNADWVDRMYS